MIPTRMDHTPGNGWTLALVISSLDTGGAERILLRLARHWTDRGANVTVITLATRDTIYDLGERVRRVDLDVGGDSANAVDAVVSGAHRVLALRRAIKAVNADVVVSFMDRTNVLTLLATRGLGVPVMVSERIDPALHSLKRPWRMLRRATYPLADVVIVQTDRAAEYFPRRLRKLIKVIPNPIDLQVPASAATSETGQPRRIVAVGRLERQKGFDLLLRAFALATATDRSWRLEIWGEGSERSQLASLAEALGIGNRIVMPGVTANIGQVLCHASIFALSSRFEGFPNALCEAMAAGVPCVAFDCQSGPREIITDGIDGILVPPGDVDALGRSLQRLMANPELREMLGQSGKRSVERFSAENVMPLWDRAMTDALSSHAGC